MLEAINISKSFPGVKVLDKVNFLFYPGKVNAILGENGAGKSTLLKVLTGVYCDFEGQIRLHGENMQFKHIKDAQHAGIAIIHQELNLIPSLSITENLFLGRELHHSLGVLRTSEMESVARSLLRRVQLEKDPSTLVKNLKVGEQQLIEIAKALLANAGVILMDEPTSALSDSEIDNLHRIIQELKTEGKTIVYISHKMEELFRIADYYTVLRDGITVEAGEMKAVSEAHLIRKMVGREVVIRPKGQKCKESSTILKVANLHLQHPLVKAKNVLHDISFELKRGEILGFFGLMGAGRTELMECLFGMVPDRMSGMLAIDGKPCQFNSPKDAISQGLAFATEDRKMEGLVLGMDISSNISLTTLKVTELLNTDQERQFAQDYIRQLAIKTPSEDQFCNNLSGGNQQKVVLAKWLATKPQILILDEPTRGIDINAKSEIYELIQRLANSGKSIILVSSEIPEILALSDRILVMAEGRITAEFSAGEAREDDLLKYAI
ncbi:sugar ABC transporter ATP-binding protein [Dyadobacter tibetensis]|uniref:sugar ABC transporter ATP-binding protein n=1 Tax=Dyadobacter tibetensis TaxID=1211851 RepID=UPI00046EC667|nr:sugar ABC transporter ATP-binding protein [Dyadobacter tibetensis]